MSDLLLELLSEEIPARMQGRAADDLKRLFEESLKKAGLSHSGIASYSTPRRLTLAVFGLPDRQPDVTEERRGPREGAPEKAIEGFLKGNGLTSLDEAELRETEKGKFWFAIRKIKGRDTADVLTEILESTLRALPWPKSMRWGENQFRWVRPLHGVLAIFGGEPLKGALDLGDSKLDFSASTSGHRFLAPEPFTVSSFEDYVEKLANAKVVLDPAVRRKVIADQAAEIATAEGLRVRQDEALLDEVAGLVEWPNTLMGKIDEAFMDLPPEVLTTSMRAHQKYFALENADGSLAPRFLLVSDMEAFAGTTRRANIIAGNERVLRPRLSDARFFWDQDRRRTLESREGDLKQVVFHAKLGTVEDKVDRVTALGVSLARLVPDADVDRVRSAARLAKADLTTGMVGEFPELQGTIGRYYALADGEHADVADAIAEHYAPLGPGDRCPSAPTSVCVALADKIDTLVGFWAIDEKPTGSKDPYALRRAALGVIRLILENRLRLGLLQVFETAHRGIGSNSDSAQIRQDLLTFFADRLKVALRDQGVRHDLIAAVFALGEDDFVRLVDRVRALSAFIESDAGSNLLIAYRRAANIVRIEEKKDDIQFSDAPAKSKLVELEEKALYEAIREAGSAADKALAAEDFGGAMDALAALRGPVDAFFEKVTVNAEDGDLRANRLRLLTSIKAILDRVADFSMIEG
ncbi:glycine--tRNA ligase subunit beta [Limibacillus halophilus]|uniref:Glycine--tRNA ligase beta subunit n=1 Tax=Limibacillus halophilus TaxID=1579333 RepID=A0A839SVS9_9PROT|nr:glycine--tRNA ligase subunit beta [Limibacillus halophilus]MBB3066911.1 glycyl-tRNA synthetase beta chain [Limibacillus halophilus]